MEGGVVVPVDFSDVVKQGYVRMRSRKLGVYRRCWLVFRKASGKGPRRLEKYGDERGAYSYTAHKATDLSGACAVLRLPRDARRHGVAITLHDGSTRSFACESELEAEEWCKLLSLECLGSRANGISQGEPDLLAAGAQREQNERFAVYLLPCPGLELFGACSLQVTPENIHLWDTRDPRLRLLTWPLVSLRRYGRDATRFTFEAGRSCDTGEGLFTFQTADGEEVYERVHAATLALAEQHRRALLELQNNARLLSPCGEDLAPSAMLPRSAYWRHITRQNSDSPVYADDAASMAAVLPRAHTFCTLSQSQQPFKASTPLLASASPGSHTHLTHLVPSADS
ncbi:docking protein 6-like [Lethenteron reissneri]|uniref:docking protein 6-like n=1 Tax=Lethenteron reissneri TaxID=7753 RepID=UPI002AB5F850|nr:docking protein 6-like [Lethenteron reissneri]